MRRSWLGVLSVALAAAGIVAYKQMRAVPTVTSTGEAAPASRARAASVLLFVDPREAEESRGCGQIIRMVRAAGAGGVTVREIAPGGSRLTREYQVIVQPTVLLLDPGGRVTARYEGESSQTIEAIRSSLDSLANATAKR